MELRLVAEHYGHLDIRASLGPDNLHHLMEREAGRDILVTAGRRLQAGHYLEGVPLRARQVGKGRIVEVEIRAHRCGRGWRRRFDS